MGDITQLLASVRSGDGTGADAALPEIYAELRRIAAARMLRHAPGQTLQPTALVHEAWLKLMGAEGHTWESRRHFFNAAGLAMQRILIDVARRRQALRHGGGKYQVEFDSIEIPLPSAPDEFLKVQDALSRFSVVDPLKAELVRLKFFVGMENKEVANTLGLPLRTVERHWRYSKAWLKVAMNGDTPPAAADPQRVPRGD